MTLLIHPYLHYVNKFLTILKNIKPLSWDCSCEINLTNYTDTPINCKL